MSRLKVSKKEAGIIAVVVIALSGTVLVFGARKNGSQNNGVPFNEIWAAIYGLQADIENIVLLPGPAGEMGPAGPKGETGEQGSIGPAGPPGFGDPDYDSGWVLISQEQIIEMRLGYNYELSAFVYVLGKFGDPSIDEPEVVHQMFLGGEFIGELVTEKVGLAWSMKADKETGKDIISVWRLEDDTFWEYVRVMVWKLPPPGESG